MEHLITITTLNDFVFCPYSIYLHQIYDLNKEDIYHDEYQSKGKRLHDFIENNKDETSWKHAYVYSDKLGIYGKIDDYNPLTKELIEYKSTVAVAYKGYYYQIWSQYLCLKEMGVIVYSLAFFDFKKNMKIEIPIPSQSDVEELINHIKKIKRFDFNSDLLINPNKCNHCIYNMLCEKSKL